MLYLEHPNIYCYIMCVNVSMSYNNQRKFNLITRRAVYYQNVNSNFSGFKSAMNIRQVYFMNPLNPTSRCERIS